MAEQLPREMTGAELKSMLKSSINFKSLGGIKVPGLKLNEEDMRWWRNAKIGMFVHWGLYSVLGKGEWAFFNEKIEKKDYEALAMEFNPENFSMTEWTELAKDFGAKYMVMVTRHHDGFALWDSAASYEDFTTAKTGAKRDFVKEYTEACRAAGLYVGYYYSPMDWRFPGYFDPKGLADNAALMKKQCYGQVEELCTSYGKPDILWYDGGWLAHHGSDTSSAWFWEPGKLNSMVRSHSPKTVINPRSGWEGDFYCDEGSHEITGGIIPVPWEKNMCLCSGTSWGWMENDPVSDFDCLIKMLVNVICRDGNLLLNVGPDKNGKLKDEVWARMRQIGAWLRDYGDAVYGTRGGPIEPIDGIYGSTCHDNIVYVHVLDRAAFAGKVIAGLPSEIISCTDYDGQVKIPFSLNEKGVLITIPSDMPPATDTIIKLTLRDDIKMNSEQIYFTGKE